VEVEGLERGVDPGDTAAIDAGVMERDKAQRRFMNTHKDGPGHSEELRG
jgi:hypothetical protein